MAIKLIKVAKEFNVGLHTIVETLHAKGFPNVEQKPTTDITDEMLVVLQKEFQKDLAIKQEAYKLRDVDPKLDASINSTPAPIVTLRPSLLPPREQTSRSTTSESIDKKLPEETDKVDATELIKRCKREKSLFLDLGNCALVELPKELFDLDWFEGLNLSPMYRNIQSGKWQNSKNTKFGNNFGSVGLKGVGRLQNLKYLYLIDCGISNLQPISELVNLKELWIDSNNIERINFLPQNNTLTTLSISKNKISDIYPLIGLGNIQYLDLSNNKIQDITPIARLSNLTTLKINYNKVSDPRALYALYNLVTLEIKGNEIIDISPLEKLYKLINLDIGYNKINQISYIKNLLNISTIFLDENPVEDCPIEVWGGNDIRQIRAYFESVIRQEKEAELNQNIVPPQISEIKLILVGNSGVGKTQLANLLITGKYEDIRDTTHGIKVSKWTPNVKALKSVYSQLRDFQINIWDFGGQEYYHGTHQLFLSNQAVYILLWDKETNINGLLPTKMDENSIAALDHFNYRYWLESIRHYAPESPILVVQNKIDIPGQEKIRLRTDDIETFKVEEDEFALSLRNAISGDMKYQRLYSKFIEELSELLRTTAKKFQFNQSWLKIRNAIQELNKGGVNIFSAALKDEAWMQLEKFNKICLQIDPNLSTDEIYALPIWLDRIGTLIYYPNNPILKHRVFLKPQWITENIYKILNKAVLAKHGEFESTGLPEDLKSQSSTFIELMKQLEIIFPHPFEKDRFVAPQYLPAEHAFEDLFAIAELGLRQSSYRIRVPLFFYRKLMHRLIMYFGLEADVTAKYYWKHGILFVTQNGTRCIIKGLYHEDNQQEGVIMIGIEQKSEFNDLQREIFERILIILSKREEEIGIKIHPRNLGVKSKLVSSGITEELDPEAIADSEFYNNPFPKNWTEIYLSNQKETPRWLAVLEVSVGDSEFIPYLQLSRAARNGISKILMKDGIVLHVNSFENLLDRKAIRPLKVFISYAHNDLDLMRRLDIHLAPLKRLEKIDSWNDRDILPGMDWDNTIKMQLKNADIVLLLITADFVASRYIWEEELKIALEKERQGSCRIIPILLRPVDFSDLPFAKTQMIPKEVDGRDDLLAVSLWKNPEEGLSIVAKEIKRVISELSGEFDYVLKSVSGY